jgi:hypothetical protein
MPRSSRLTFLGAAMAALMGPALAQEGAGTAKPVEPAEAQSAPAKPSSQQERPQSPGCPYRDNKLELIV